MSLLGEHLSKFDRSPVAAVYDRRRSVSATSPAVIDRRYSSTNQILSQTAQRGLHLRIVWIQALKEKVMFQ